MVGAGQITGVTISAQTINTMNLSINSVGFDQIIANAVTLPDYSFHDPTPAFTGTSAILVSKTIEVKSGSVIMLYSSQWNSDAANSDITLFAIDDFIDFLVDGSVVRSFFWYSVATASGGNYTSTQFSPICQSWNITGLSAGNHTFSVRARCQTHSAFPQARNSKLTSGAMFLTDFRR